MNRNEIRVFVFEDLVTFFGYILRMILINSLITKTYIVSIVPIAARMK